MKNLVVCMSKAEPNVVYIRLPKSSQRPMDLECCCHDEKCNNKWDTLAVATGDNASVWTVHFPDLETSKTVNRWIY